MDDHAFDHLAMFLAQPFNRRTLLGGLIAASVPGLGKTRAEVLATSQDQGGLVFDYYQAIDAHKYKTAYSYLGAKFTARQTLENFTAGFSDTVYDDLIIHAVHPDSANNRVVYDVTITAWHVDGSVLFFAGTYTEGRENGRTKLIDAAIQPTKSHAVAPLCKASGLTASMSGDAGAGQRYGSVTVTNSASHACVLGDIPRVTLRAENGRKLMNARQETGFPITTITLDPGQQAVLEMHWSNWCGDANIGRPGVSVQLSGERGTMAGLTGIGVPPCLSEPGGTTTFRVKPWQRIS